MSSNVEPVQCRCYKCTETVYGYDEHGRYIKNNLHGKLQACEQCGRPKTEYVDRYTHGYYECWWCEYRAADGDMHD